MLLTVIAVAFAALVLYLALFRVPPLLLASFRLEPAEYVVALREERRTVIALLAAVGAAVGLAYTHLRHKLQQDENRTERYSRAIEQLGHETLAIRLGGIYALERIAEDSPRDRSTIIDVLSTFLREETAKAGTLGADTEAALAVLFRERKFGSSYPAVDLRRANLAGADLTARTLSGAILRGADLTGSRLEGVDLSGADLTGAILTEANLEGASLRGARLNEAILTDTILHECDMRGASLVGAQLSDARMYGADLSGADLSQIRADGGKSWDGTKFMNAKMRGTKLRYAKFRHVDFDGADMRRADLTGAEFSVTAHGENINFTGARLDGVHIESGAQFWHCRFRRARLTNMRAQGAVLSGGDFGRADLSGANLQGADLSGNNPNGLDTLLTDARMSRAVLTDARLSGATMIGANLRGVNLRGALLDGVYGLSPGQAALLEQPLTPAQRDTLCEPGGVFSDLRRRWVNARKRRQLYGWRRVGW